MSGAPKPLVLATLNFPPKPGGIEQLCAELARELVALGTELHVIAPRSPGFEEFDARAPYRVTRYPGGALRHLHLAGAVARLTRSERRRVLFAQWTGAPIPVFYEALAREGSSFAVIAHGKEFLTPEQGSRSQAWFTAYRRAVLGRFSVVFAVSAYTAEKARGAGAKTVRPISLGVDATRFARAAEQKREQSANPGASRAGSTILTLARLVPRKGVDTLIAALPALSRRHADLRCLVAGDGPDRPRLEALAAASGVRERVSFLGRVEDSALPELYAQADLFTLLSREDPRTGDAEGFGLVLLEAQAAGTPVIAARSGGMPDALRDGTTGLLVPPDDPARFVEAAETLLADPARLSAMSHAALEFARARTWRKTAEQVLEALDAH